MTTATRKKNGFTLLFKVPGGHKFFTDHSNERIAIADDSGATPPQTTDGTMWVDTTKPILMGKNGYAVLPLQTIGGIRTATGISPEFVMFLASELQMKVETPKGSYTVIKV
jgi:hypothetical protein